MCEQTAVPATAGLSRRTLLQGAGALGGAALLSAVAPPRVALAATAPSSRLVVVFLRGGVDGLSLLAPVGDPDYAAARPTLALPTARALPVDRFWGWHPDAAELASMYRAGQLAPVVAVAEPGATRSHFEAMERLETCSSASVPRRTGWLDRYAGAVGLSDTFSSVAVGGLVPRALNGPTPELVVPSVDGFGVRTRGSAPDFLRALRTVNGGTGTADVLMRNAMDASARLAPLKRRPLGRYPASQLGRGLHDVATMMRGGLPVQVAAVDGGGWDMHVGLGARAGVDGGWMGRQVQDLSRSLSAFAADLGPLWKSTTVVVLSEFGRQVVENRSGGVDHGCATTWLVAGGAVRGGQVLGSWPTLRPATLDDGAVPGRVDPRQVLAEVLANGCGASANAVRAAVPDAPGGTLGLFA
jgi:uncharacterized protein (DUF1501 family)